MGLRAELLVLTGLLLGLVVRVGKKEADNGSNAENGANVAQPRNLNRTLSRKGVQSEKTDSGDDWKRDEGKGRRRRGRTGTGWDCRPKRPKVPVSQPINMEPTHLER